MKRVNCFGVLCFRVGLRMAIVMVYIEGNQVDESKRENSFDGYKVSST